MWWGWQWGKECEKGQARSHCPGKGQRKRRGNAEPMADGRSAERRKAHEVPSVSKTISSLASSRTHCEHIGVKQPLGWSLLHEWLGKAGCRTRRRSKSELESLGALFGSLWIYLEFDLPRSLISMDLSKQYDMLIEAIIRPPRYVLNLAECQ